MTKGTSYITSDSIKISVANKEIIPDPPDNWTVPYKIRKMSLYNKQACNVIFEDIHGTYNQFLSAGQGFFIGYNDPEILSLKIQQDDIEYNIMMVW